MATDLFTDFHAQMACRLRLLDLQVQREARSFFESGLEGVTVRVRRSVRDDAPSPLEGGFEVEVDDNFDEF